MIPVILAISTLVGLHETAAQHGELTKDSATGLATIVNAGLYGSFAAMFWPLGIAFYLCGRYGRQTIAPAPQAAPISQTTPAN